MPPKSKLTVEQLLEGIREGLDVPSMARKFGCCKCTIRNTAMRYGVKIPESDYHKTTITEEQLKELMEQKMSATQMAVYLEKDVTTVRKYLHKYGLIPTNKRGKSHREKAKEDDALLKGALYIDNSRKAHRVTVDGKQYLDTFELMWEEPKEENPYKWVGKKKPMKGLYG